MNKYPYISLLLCLALLGCEESYDTTLDIVANQLIIYGRVSDFKDDSYVEIGRTVDKRSKPVSVSGAEVFILDGEGERIDFCEKREGHYKPVDSEFRGKTGHGYQLLVKLNSGQSFQSEVQIVPNRVEIDSVYTEFEQKEQLSEAGLAFVSSVIQMYLDTQIRPDEGEELFMRWDIEETFSINQTTPPRSFPPPEYVICYVTRNTFAQEVKMQSTENITIPELSIHLGERTIDYTFDYKFALTFYQRSITKESFEYWTEINKVSSVSGSIFDSPPATVIGNIVSNEDGGEPVLGYFEASGTSMRRLFFRPVDFPIFITPDCNWSFRKDRYPGYCLDCLRHEGSTLEAPDWFLADSLVITR